MCKGFFFFFINQYFPLSTRKFYYCPTFTAWHVARAIIIIITIIYLQSNGLGSLAGIGRVLLWYIILYNLIQNYTY